MANKDMDTSPMASWDSKMSIGCMLDLTISPEVVGHLETLRQLSYEHHG